MERFAPRLAEYVYEAYAQGMTLSGSRSHRLIPYSEDFLMLTRPSTAIGTVKIHPSRGITVNGLHYWHDSMRAALVSGKSVPVRYEPFDMGFVYAYIGGELRECIADAFAQGQGRSERHWNLILDE